MDHVKNLESIEIHPIMTKVYPCVARPGYAWYPNYNVFVQEVRLTAGNGLAENDHRNLPLQISAGSKREFSRITKMLLPNAKIVWPIKVAVSQ